MQRAAQQFLFWASDIKSTKGFVLRSFLCALCVLVLLALLIAATIQLIHPRAPLVDTLIHYYIIIVAFVFTIPACWIYVCRKGLGRWYISYIVGCAHALAAVIIVNLSRFLFVPDLHSTIYFDAKNQLGAFFFVTMVEFSYFWAIAGIGSVFYVFLTTNIFPTMQTWFVDNPLLPCAPVSPSRPKRPKPS